MTAHHFAVTNLPATPWRNGGGTTRQLATWPRGADAERFTWRVSVATIGTDAPFSPFPGVDRIITLLEGDGVRLQGPGVDHRLDRPHRPFHFDGATAIGGTVLGPRRCTALNVMTRRGHGRSSVEVVTGPTTVALARGLLLGLRGDWHVDGDHMTAGTGAWCADPVAWRLEPAGRDSQLAVVGWRPA